MKPNPLPPLDFLTETFEVSSSSPSWLVWKKPNKKAVRLKPGDRAGNLLPDGYWQIKLTHNNKTKLYQVHRIVYAIANQKNIDNVLIDHKEGKDNNPLNLREASYVNNSCNRKPHSLNKRTSKYKGVYFTKCKWRAVIQCNGIRKHIGYFQSEKEAAIAYNFEAVKIHGEYAKLNLIEKNK